jgi:hypothetical protein
MTNWKSLAAARCPDIPEEAVAGIVPSLEGLESAFRPLVETLTADVDPALTFAPMASHTGEGR